MKKIIIILICLFLIGYTVTNSNKISTFIAKNLTSNHKIITEEINEYAKSEGFMYVKITDNFVPYSYNDLKNIVYSVINNGWTNFTFYCPSEYTECINDMAKLSNNEEILTHINNFVHPFNSFTSLSTVTYESGEINLTINHLYTDTQISKINDKITSIINDSNIDNLKDYDKIKTLHDYIINNTKYDETKNETGESNYESTTAYGVLFNNYATCNGYTDTMAIILSKLGFKNYKIATTPDDISYRSSGHVWNAVYIDNKWLHLDLTWDDPVSSDGKDYLYHKYFLVNNEELKKSDDGNVSIEEHNFKKSIYLEFNDSINATTSS